MLPGIRTFEPKYGVIRHAMAPMAGITDTVFRLLMREMGASLVVSELLSAEGLVRGGARTRDMLKFDERERPIGIQIFGPKVGSLVDAAKIVEQTGADFVDINFGCPVRKIVCDGGGSAWLKNPLALGTLFASVKANLKIPLTIKVRTGWDESTINVKEIVHIAAESGVEWVAIHGRTRAQGYSGLADWELIREVSHNSSIPILGNGDLVTAVDAKKKLDLAYCHAVMIGRGALKNPWIFREINGEIIHKNLPELIRRHFSLAIEKKDRHRAFLSLKKFLAWYSAGYPGCSVFRSRIFSIEGVDELERLALDYFSTVDPVARTDDSSPFLMGGHG